MSYSKVRIKIQQFSNNNFINNSIIRKIKGSYYLYNMYRITNNNGIWEVRKYNQYINGFEDSSTATAWCMADKTNRIADAINLVILDNRLQRKKTDIQIRTRFLNQSDISYERKIIAISRIAEDSYTCKCIKSEIRTNYILRINTHNL